MRHEHRYVCGSARTPPFSGRAPWLLARHQVWPRNQNRVISVYDVNINIVLE